MLLPLLALETAVWSPLGPGAAWIRNAPSSETRLDHEPEQPQSKSSLMPAGGVSERPPLVPKTPSRASFACDVVTDGAVTVAVLLETRPVEPSIGVVGSTPFRPVTDATAVLHAENRHEYDDGSVVPATWK
jgi:hypothetical protein